MRRFIMVGEFDVSEDAVNVYAPVGEEFDLEFTVFVDDGVGKRVPLDGADAIVSLCTDDGARAMQWAGGSVWGARFGADFIGELAQVRVEMNGGKTYYSNRFEILPEAPVVQCQSAG